MHYKPTPNCKSKSTESLLSQKHNFTNFKKVFPVISICLREREREVGRTKRKEGPIKAMKRSKEYTKR